MKLVFVYNANSGKLNAYLDSLHKIVSPATYPCSLCDLTYGVFKIRPRWKEFRESSNLDMDFLHIDEFKKAYPLEKPSQYNFPVILKENNEELKTFVSKEEMDNLKTEEELIVLIQERVTTL